MLARIQRILAAIEIFALVLWVGGLFFITAIAAGTPRLLPGIEKADLRAMLDVLYRQFNRLEPVFGIVIVASNFMKVLVFGRLLHLQRVALMVSTIMFFLMLTYTSVLWPRIEEKRKEVAALNEINRSKEAKKLSEYENDFVNLMGMNFLCGLFMVYAYRAFEERKLQALAKVLNVQSQP